MAVAAEPSELICPGDKAWVAESSDVNHKVSASYDPESSRCFNEFLDSKHALLLELSGAPIFEESAAALTSSFVERSKIQHLMEFKMQMQYGSCVQAGFEYFRMTAALGRFFDEAEGEAWSARWQALPRDLRAQREAFGICAPSSCSPEQVMVQIYPWFFRMLCIADFEIPTDALQGVPLPAPFDHLRASAFSQGSGSMQTVWDVMIRNPKLLRRTLEPPEDFASYLEVSTCMENFDQQLDPLHRFAAPLGGAPGAGAVGACLAEGMRFVRLEVLDWCALPPTHRTKVRKALRALGTQRWLDLGLPLHLCIPVQCSDAAIRAILVPDYLSRLLLVVGPDVGGGESAKRSVVAAAAETSFWRSPAAFRVDDLTEWREVAIHGALIGLPGAPFRRLAAALASASRVAGSSAEGLVLRGPTSAARRSVGEVAELRGEELPLKRHVKALLEEGEQEVQHSIRMLRCDAKKGTLEEREACMKHSEALTPPTVFPLSRHRVLVDATLGSDGAALRRLALIPGLRIVALPRSWHEGLPSAADEELFDFWRRELPQDRFFLLSSAQRDGQAPEETERALIDEAIRFLAAPGAAATSATPRRRRAIVAPALATAAPAPPTPSLSSSAAPSVTPWAVTWPQARVAEARACRRALGAERLPSLLRLSSPHSEVGSAVACRQAGHLSAELSCARLPGLLARCRPIPCRVSASTFAAGMQLCVPQACGGSIVSLGMAVAGLLPAWAGKPGGVFPALRPSELGRLLSGRSREELRNFAKQRAWSEPVQEAICTPSARRRRRGPSQLGKHSGCSCEGETIPCIDVDACAALAPGGRLIMPSWGPSSEASDEGTDWKPRFALVTIHDLQIPFEAKDDRLFRRYLRPAHYLFYEQEGLKMIRDHYGLDHVLLVPELRLAKFPLKQESRVSLAQRGVRIVEVPWVYPAITESVFRETHADSQTFGPGEFIRIHLWNLTEYDAVLYLDHDMLLVGDVTPMLLCSHATGIYLTSSGNTAPLNLGLHSLRPNEGVFKAMVEVLSRTEYEPENGFTSVPGRNTWGIIEWMGLDRGSAHAGLQGFLYYFFYRGDEVVQQALERHGVPRTIAAQVARCMWNYSKNQLIYKYVSEDHGTATKLPEASDYVFRCSLGPIGRPAIVHKFDETMYNFLMRDRSELDDEADRSLGATDDLSTQSPGAD